MASAFIKKKKKKKMALDVLLITLCFVFAGPEKKLAKKNLIFTGCPWETLLSRFTRFRHFFFYAIITRILFALICLFFSMVALKIRFIASLLLKFFLFREKSF